MRFTLGLAIGFAAGYWYGSQPEDERRRQLEGAVQKVRDDPRFQKVGDTVSRNAHKVTEAVGARATDTADRAGDTVASAARPGTAGDAPPPNDDLPGTGIG